MLLPCRVYFPGNAFKPFTVSLKRLSKSVLSRSNLIDSWCYRKNSAGVFWEAECSTENRKFCKAVPLGSKSFFLSSLYEYLYKEFWWAIWSGKRSNRDWMDQWFFFSFRNAWWRTFLKPLCFVSLGTYTQLCWMLKGGFKICFPGFGIYTMCSGIKNKRKKLLIFSNLSFYVLRRIFPPLYGIRVISAFSG